MRQATVFVSSQPVRTLRLLTTTAEYRIEHTPPQGGQKVVVKLYVECKEDQVRHSCSCGADSRLSKSSLNVLLTFRLTVESGLRLTVALNIVKLIGRRKPLNIACLCFLRKSTTRCFGAASSLGK